MGVGGEPDVLGAGGAEHGHREGVDGPEGVVEVAEELVGQGFEEHGVEEAVLLGEGRAGVGQALHLDDDLVDAPVLAPVPGGDDLVGQRGVEQGAHLDDVAQAAVVVAGLEQAPEDERLDHGAHGDLPDEHAVAVAHLDDVEGDEGAHGLAHRGARDAQVGAQLGLGRQRVAGFEVGLEDVVLDRVDGRGGLRRRRLVEGGVGSALRSHGSHRDHHSIARFCPAAPRGRRPGARGPSLPQRYFLRVAGGR